MLEQTFPDEVLDLDRSVRTLDVTNNKIGVSCTLLSYDFMVVVTIMLEKLFSDCNHPCIYYLIKIGGNETTNYQ